MTQLAQIKELLQEKFGAESVHIASVGGSGTFGIETRDAPGFPEALGIAPYDTVVHVFRDIQTPFGHVPVLKILQIGGVPLVRVPYHGWTLPWPTAENTLATFWLLYQLGVTQVLADASVGGIGGAAPRDIIVPSDIVPGDQNRRISVKLAQSIGMGPWVRMINPFCPTIRGLLIGNAQEYIAQDGQTPDGFSLGNLYVTGTDYTTQLGPFESTPEIAMIAKMVPDVIAVNQSSGLEALCARICGMCYAVLHIAANYAEGLGDASWNPDNGGMVAFYKSCPTPVGTIAWNTLLQIVSRPSKQQCICQSHHSELDLAQFA